MFRIGLGQDSHRYSKKTKKPLILGGVKIPGNIRVDANSDGDAVIHAICRAIEQALGNECFSYYADKMCREGISNSVEYLETSSKNARKKGYAMNNIGIMIETKVPKIIPISNQIKKNLAKLSGLKESQIGISATSGEGLTAFGQGKGIQVFAIVSLVKRKK